eukprot:13124727-Alexandrium_andersonii.AAC.1
MGTPDFRVNLERAMGRVAAFRGRDEGASENRGPYQRNGAAIRLRRREKSTPGRAVPDMCT